MKIINLVENTAGSSPCGCEHGLCFYVETEKHRLLADSGATDLFIRNAALRNVDLTKVDALILSHGHYDHAGGIMAFSEINPGAKIYLRESAGGEYYHLTDRGEKYIGIDKRIMKLTQCVRVEGDLRIDEELFLFTNITGSKFPAKGNLELKKKAGSAFVQDSFAHEQCLVITEGDRHVLMSGCAHTGIVNILDRYEELFHADPDVVISGFHLMQKEAYTEAERETIRQMAEVLADKPSVFYTGHCTGAAAYAIMKDVMGEKLQPIHSGDEICL